MNIPLSVFKADVARLGEPDPQSNSPDHEGRRIIPSEGERGYKVVNFLKYRNIRDEEQRRNYMRNYVTKYRAQGRDKSRPPSVVNSVNTGKEGKSLLAEAEAEVEAKAPEEAQAQPPPEDSLVKKPSKAAASPANDDIWLSELSKDTAYASIDVTL